MAERWTCSFCALSCDDLQVVGSGERLRIDPTCELAAQRITALESARSLVPQRRGEAIAWNEAVEMAKDRLRDASSIRITGTLGDFELARATIELAESWHAALNLDATFGQQALATAISRDGVTAATFGDVRLHADRVVLLGNVDAVLPRFRERFAADKPCLTLESTLAYEATAAANNGGTEVLDVGDWTDWLRQVLLVLRTDLAAGSDTVPTGSVSRFLEFMRDARYIAFVVSPLAFNVQQDRLAAEWLLRLVERLGQTARGVLLVPDDSAAGRNTMLWRTGFAGAVQFSDGAPTTHTIEAPASLVADASQQTATPDGICFSRSGEAGVSIRIAPPSSRPRRLEDSMPSDAFSILIGDATTPPEAAAAADLFLPAAWPGIDLTGTTVRGDGSVTLPLKPLPGHGLPSAAARSVLELLAGLRRTAI